MSRNGIYFKCAILLSLLFLLTCGCDTNREKFGIYPERAIIFYDTTFCIDCQPISEMFIFVIENRSLRDISISIKPTVTSLLNSDTLNSELVLLSTKGIEVQRSLDFIPGRTDTVAFFVQPRLAWFEDIPISDRVQREFELLSTGTQNFSFEVDGKVKELNNLDMKVQICSWGDEFSCLGQELFRRIRN